MLDLDAVTGGKADLRKPRHLGPLSASRSAVTEWEAGYFYSVVLLPLIY